METNEDAERCIKYLNRSVFEGRLVTVEKVLVSSEYLSHCSVGCIDYFHVIFFSMFLSLEMSPDKLWQQVWSV